MCPFCLVYALVLFWQPVRLYVKGVMLGFKRGLRNTYHHTSLIKIQASSHSVVRGGGHCCHRRVCVVRISRRKTRSVASHKTCHAASKDLWTVMVASHDLWTVMLLHMTCGLLYCFTRPVDLSCLPARPKDSNTTRRDKFPIISIVRPDRGAEAVWWMLGAKACAAVFESQSFFCFCFHECKR